MILARVVAQLKAQQWTSVFNELAIVVLGVFIGIQASNWNSAQVERHKCEDFAVRLLKDLRQDLLGRERMVAYYQAVEESGEITANLLASGGYDPQMLLVNAYRATEFNSYTLARSTWDELVSSGEIGILPASVDEADISTFFAFDSSKDAKEAIERSAYRQRVRRIIPQAVQKAIRAGCSDVLDEIGNIVAFKPECKLAVSTAEVEFAAAELAKDPNVLPDLRLHFSDINSAINNLSGEVILLKRAVASFDRVERAAAGKP